MPINRGKNKEDVAHIYDEILLSHKKTNLSPGEVEEPRVKSEREQQILYINAYI